MSIPGAGGPNGFVDVGCGCSDGRLLQVVGVGVDGDLWHTLNDDRGWQSVFGRVRMKVPAGGPGAFTRVACVGGKEILHIVGVGTDGELWHTFRRDRFRPPDKEWQEFFGRIRQVVKGGPTAGFVDVSCGFANGQLHVVGTGADGDLWHTVTETQGWQSNFGELNKNLSSGPPAFSRGTAAGCDGPTDKPAHVVGVGLDGDLYHAFRKSDGSWSSSFTKVFSKPPVFVDVGCGAIGGRDLQVVGVGADGTLWHAIRSSETSSWQSSSQITVSGAPSGFVDIACAGASETLHTVGVG